MPNRRLILCIEDDAETRELLTEELQDAGYVVHAVGDGAAGLERIAAERPALVLCDVDMPGLSGFDVLKRVRALDPAARTVPFIFLTAYGQRENQLQAWRLGCDDYVVKPIDFELLCEIIRARLNRPAERAEDVKLSAREIDALTWSARGKTSRDIATIMNVSERTVNFHIDNAIRKLGVSTRIQAAVKGALLGVIEP